MLGNSGLVQLLLRAVEGVAQEPQTLVARVRPRGVLAHLLIVDHYLGLVSGSDAALAEGQHGDCLGVTAVEFQGFEDYVRALLDAQRRKGLNQIVCAGSV